LAPNAPCSAADPAAITSIERESIHQKTSDLERTGRGGQLEHGALGRCAHFVSVQGLQLKFGILVATLCTRPLRLQHSGRHGTYSNAKTEHPKRTGRYSTASILALQSPRQILDRYDCGLPIATAHARSLQLGIPIAKKRT
jgi:hypothetical protein